VEEVERLEVKISFASWKRGLVESGGPSNFYI
jgi:hypothetical protein